MSNVECRMSNEHQSPTKFRKPTATHFFHESFHIEVVIDFHHWFCYRCKKKTNAGATEIGTVKKIKWENVPHFVLFWPTHPFLMNDIN